MKNSKDAIDKSKDENKFADSIVYLQDKLQKKHNKFLEEYKYSYIQVQYEYNKRCSQVSSKLSFIFDVLISLNILDGYQDGKNLYNDDYFVLFSDNCKHRIKIDYTPSCIKISSNEDKGLNSSVLMYHDILGEDFNWDKFTLDVLNYIHKYIYFSKEALDFRISYSF